MLGTESPTNGGGGKRTNLAGGGRGKSKKGTRLRDIRVATCVRGRACICVHVHTRRGPVHGCEGSSACPCTLTHTQSGPGIKRYPRACTLACNALAHVPCLSKSYPSSEIWIFQLVEHTEQNVTLRYTRGGKGLRE